MSAGHTTKLIKFEFNKLPYPNRLLRIGFDKTDPLHLISPVRIAPNICRGYSLDKPTQGIEALHVPITVGDVPYDTIYTMALHQATFLLRRIRDDNHERHPRNQHT